MPRTARTARRGDQVGSVVGVRRAAAAGGERMAATTPAYGPVWGWRGQAERHIRDVCAQARARPHARALDAQAARTEAGSGSLVLMTPLAVAAWFSGLQRA